MASFTKHSGCHKMKLVDIKEKIPPAGMLAFNGIIVVRFSQDGGFYTYNGAWRGVYDGEKLIAGGMEHPSPPFRGVVEYTPDEARRYYITDKPKIVVDDDDIPY